jgi:TadE-like protein
MRSRWGDRGEDGSVTAEFAVVLPAVILVLACCLGAVQVIGQQVRMTDAAAAAARVLARGDAAALAESVVRRSVPGASVRSEQRGEFVCVHLDAPSAFGLFVGLGLTIEAGSCALSGGL